MKKVPFILFGAALSFVFNFALNFDTAETSKLPFSSMKADAYTTLKPENSLKLGAFSVSLSVKDLNVSKQFYENLGFKVFGGSMQHNYLIMKNENTLIGLFQGMFSGNMLTFNPGWDENAKNIDSFDDIREIQKQLKLKDIKLSLEVAQNSKGPGSIMTTDPDGNVILIDQHR
jgi:catechol 2,3-dioxygenase-like lactoylglutathione lyase family enzyme